MHIGDKQRQRYVNNKENALENKMRTNMSPEGSRWPRYNRLRASKQVLVNEEGLWQSLICNKYSVSKTCRSNGVTPIFVDDC